jgi:cathepsin D
VLSVEWTCYNPHQSIYHPFSVVLIRVSVAVTDVSSGLIDGELAGIMGLAFQGIASSTALPFWQALISDNLLTNPEFSFFVTRFSNDASAQAEEPGGVLTLGGTNSTLYQGDIDFRSFASPINEGSYWLQTVTGASHSYTLTAWLEHVSQVSS